MIESGQLASWRQQIRLHARTTRRSLRVYGFHPTRMVGRVRDDIVFIVGCPRSGTTFTAKVLGSVTGFTDLGELKPWRGAVPELHALAGTAPPDELTARIRRILVRNQRLAMAARRRAIEQSPESSFLIPQLAAAFPRAHFVHVLRDGRDVAASLVDRGWLGDGAAGRDDAGLALGGYARFWVEPGRESEFEQSSEARRCGWAWRRYVSTARAALAGLDPARATELRYEDFVTDARAAAATVAAGLGAQELSAEFEAGFRGAHRDSVGIFRTRLSAAQIADVLAEEAPLLRELGYPAAA